jgi:hypothetical protein
MRRCSRGMWPSIHRGRQGCLEGSVGGAFACFERRGLTFQVHQGPGGGLRSAWGRSSSRCLAPKGSLGCAMSRPEALVICMKLSVFLKLDSSLIY